MDRGQADESFVLRPRFVGTQAALDLRQRGYAAGSLALLRSACRSSHASELEPAGACQRTEDPADHPEVWLAALVRSGERHQDAGDQAAAAPLLDDAMRVFRCGGLGPTDAMRWLIRLERLLVNQERWSEAEEVSWRILDSQNGGSSRLQVSEELARLARIQGEIGVGSAAEACLRSSLAIRRECLGAGHESTLRVLHDLAGFLARHHQPSRAAGVFAQLRERVGQPQIAHRSAREALASLTQQHQRQGSWRAAHELGRSRLALSRRMFGRESHTEVLDSLRELAAIAIQSSSLDEAQRRSEELLRASAVQTVSHDRLAVALSYGAWARCRQSRWLEAEEMLLSALGLSYCLFGVKHPRVTWILESLAAVAAASQRLPTAWRRWRLAVHLDHRLAASLARGCFRHERVLVERCWRLKTERILSFVWRYGSQDPQLCRLARDVALGYRPTREWIRGAEFWSTSGALHPELRQELRHLFMLNAQINRHMLAGLESDSASVQSKVVGHWRRDADALWRYVQERGVSLDLSREVQPPGSVEFRQFIPRDLAAPFDAVDRPARPRLLALVERLQRIEVVDFGPVDPRP